MTGLHYQPETSVCTFSVWAPQKERMILHLVLPEERTLEMVKQQDGVFTIEVEGIKPGCRYFYQPEGESSYPDPASQFQPEGVHGPSEVVDHSAYTWNDQSWKGLPFRELIIYEVHIGTATEKGTFESLIDILDDLTDTGINAIEIMPVGQFPGARNWGYDGVFSYAPQHSYGGPQGLKKLVDACHQKGIAVILDVVYNHMGPEGNYFSQFGPYFTDRYHCPWGDAINFDGQWSDGVREYFSDNPVYWFEHFHIDGLRVDAVHTIFDNGAVSIWELIHSKINLLEQRLGRSLYMIAESDLNSPRVLKEPEYGGYGFDAQWLDDFHHALYVILDKNGKDRYADFGRTEQLAKAYTDGFVHSGEYVEFRKRKYGASSAGIPGDRFVAFNNNHDQCGNRIKGETLASLIDFERLKLAAAALLLSPYVPMLFMGEEYASDRPYFFFGDYTDPQQSKAVNEGRKKEFAVFGNAGDMPDPGDIKTFYDSKLQWNQRSMGKHKIMLDWYKTLITLRRNHPVLTDFNKNNIRAQIIEQHGLVLHRQNDGAFQKTVILLNFSEQPLPYVLPDYGHEWRKQLDSKNSQWMEHPVHSTLPETAKGGERIYLAPLSALIYDEQA